MKYILDANVFIEAHRRYYAFDLAPKFWDELVNYASSGKIVCIDRVQEELKKGNDTLTGWIKTCSFSFPKTVDSATITAYSQVMQWAQDEPRFTDAARAEFASVADGWIVAYAKAHGCIVVTQEVASNAQKRVKIPDVCNALSVPYVNTFIMLRQLGVKFT